MYYRKVCSFPWASSQIKLQVVHAPGMPGTFSLPLRVSNPKMHHDTCMHVPCCTKGSLTSCFLWSRWRGKGFLEFLHSRCMHNPQFYVTGKRPMDVTWYSSICMSTRHSRSGSAEWTTISKMDLFTRWNTKTQNCVHWNISGIDTYTQ